MTYTPIPEPPNATKLKALQALTTQRNLLSALEIFHRDVGDVFRLKLGGLNAVMLVGAEANRLVLVTARDTLQWRTEGDPVTRLLREGVLVTDGEKHDALRRIMNPSLHKRELTHYVESMVRYTDAVMSQWSIGDTEDMLVEMRKIALMVLTETLFKVDVSSDIHRLWQPILKTIQYISPGLWILWNQMPRPGYADKINTLNAYLYQIIDERRASNANDSDDLLGALIASGMDNDMIRDQLLTMLIAGHDTSTALLAWALYLLTTHPESMTKVQREIQDVLGDNPPTIESVSQLTYLGQVIDEVLRLYPPIHLGSRYTAEDTEFIKYVIPAGTRVMYSIYLTHRDPKYWDQPAKFDPERFSSTNKRRIPAYAYLPFGGGARNCIGTAFALVEAKVILARILQQVDLQFTGHPVRTKMGATLEPYPGVRVRVGRNVN